MFWVILLCVIGFFSIKLFERPQGFALFLCCFPIAFIIVVAMVNYFYFYTPTYLQKEKNIIENYDVYSKTDTSLVTPKNEHIRQYNLVLIEARTKKKSVASHIFGFAWAIDSDVTEYELIKVE